MKKRNQSQFWMGLLFGLLGGIFGNLLVSAIYNNDSTTLIVSSILLVIIVTLLFIHIFYPRKNKKEESVESENSKEGKSIIEWVLIMVAIISIICSIILHYDTAKTLKPFQKPILNLEKTEITGKLLEIGDVEINIVLFFKNYGKGIAQNTKITIFIAPLNKPEELKHFFEKTIANDIYPETFFNKNFEDKIPKEFVKFSQNTITINNINLPDIAFIIKLNYEDKRNGEIIEQIFWMLYKPGKSGGYHLTIEEKNKLMPYYEDLIQNEKT